MLFIASWAWVVCAWRDLQALGSFCGRLAEFEIT